MIDSTFTVAADMAATVYKILVSPGDEVGPGIVLVVLESMKMEIPIETEFACVVTAVHVTDGATVGEGAALVTLARRS
jgi:acetyl-CoA carboxylase biotin carboxyl carrier protein